MNNYKIEDLDPSKTYLIGVEVGDSNKDETLSLLTHTKEVCESKGIKAIYYATNHGVGSIKVKDLIHTIDNLKIEL